MLNILVIEDNKIIANNIKKYLEIDGHNITIAENGLYGMEIVKNKQFDIVVLDLMLPGMDGITICNNLKHSQPDLPVIITSAKGQIEDKLELFDSGADDYLVKPFDIKELVARIWVVLKRTPKRELIEIGNIILNRELKSIKKDGLEIKFTLKEFLILELLMLNNGITVSRTDIVQEIWGNESIFEVDAKLDVYISNIRKKLGKEYIETIKGFGYKFGKSS
ncbi:MAG: response regulator transcription factor [Candidatus Absconditabacteria bacterium]